MTDSLIEQFEQLRKEDEAIDARRDALVAQLRRNEGMDIEAATEAATVRLVTENKASEASATVETGETTSSPSDAPTESPTASSEPSATPADPETQRTEAATAAADSSGLLGSEPVTESAAEQASTAAEAEKHLSDVSTNLGGGGVTVTGGEEKKVVQETAGVGGGDSSPQDLAIGFQPAPGKPLNEQLSPQAAEPDEATQPQPKLEDFAKTNFGTESLTNPDMTREEKAKAAESKPEITHQATPGSGIAPGAAIPGESVEDREKRHESRTRASEIKRLIENGNLSLSGRLEIGETGGFDIRLGEGDEVTRLSDVLRGRNNALVDLNGFQLRSGF